MAKDKSSRLLQVFFGATRRNQPALEEPKVSARSCLRRQKNSRALRMVCEMSGEKTAVLVSRIGYRTARSLWRAGLVARDRHGFAIPTEWGVAWFNIMVAIENGDLLGKTPKGERRRQTHTHPLFSEPIEMG